MLLGKAFAIRLRELIDKNNMTVYKLSKLSSVHRSTIDSILNGEVKTPTLATLYQICAGLNLSPIEFLDCETMLNYEIDIYTRKN